MTVPTPEEIAALEAAALAAVRGAPTAEALDEAVALHVRRGRMAEILRSIASLPVDARARYNVFAALSIMARHQHRHLWQAEQAARLVSG